MVGYSWGEHDFDNLNNQVDDEDSENLDMGAGVLIPLENLGFSGPLEWVNKHGFAVRAEYRYRQSDIDNAPDFDDHIVSVGLQIPLGTSEANRPKPVAPPPAPAPAAPADSDGDGVPDNRDQCPGTPAGTQVNANGCPIQKAAPVVLKGVTFEFDSARLTAQSQDRLNNVVNALQANTSVNGMIGGHTDSIGSSSYNLDLSQRRAASVRQYLSSHGVDLARLSSQGYGETRPVAPNTKPNGSDNPAGRAQNRRVELNVVK